MNICGCMKKLAHLEVTVTRFFSFTGHDIAWLKLSWSLNFWERVSLQSFSHILSFTYLPPTKTIYLNLQKKTLERETESRRFSV